MSTHRSTHFESTLRTSHAERSLRTRMRVLTSLVPLALGLLPAACAPATPDDGVSPALETTPVAPALDPDAAIDAPAKKITLVALTPISRAKAPMLSNLADRFTLVDVAQGAARLGKATEPAELDALLEGASALVADVAQLGAGDLETIRPLADAAAEAGVPLVLENITEADRMTALVGLGMKADGALVESWNRARNAKITLLGHSEVTSGGDADQATISKARKAELGLHYWEMSDAEREAVAVKTGKTPNDLAAEVDEAIAQRDQVLAAQDEARPSLAQVEASPDQLAEQVAERLIALRDQPVVKTKTLVLGPSHPIGTYKSYVVQQPAYTWQPVVGGSQTATMDIQFKVELVASSTDNRKYMVVTDAGSGFNPGTMIFDDNEARAFFQDSLEVSIHHSDPGLTMNSHQPTTVNGESTYSTTSGCEFGGTITASGPETSFTCSASNTETRTISDFSPLDQSAGLTAKWKFHMTNAPGYGVVVGGAYNSWIDLVDTVFSGHLRNVPALAKSNLDPQFEAIYWADSTFAKTVPLSFGFKQTLRNTWIENYTVFSVDSYTTSFTKSSTLALSADFSRVSTSEAWVSLTAKSSQKCVNVEGAGSVSGAAVSQRTCTEADNQVFDLVKTIDQDGYTLIKPRQGVAYNMCLTVGDASTAENEKIFQSPCLATGNDHQKFMLMDSGGGYTYLRAKHSNKCLSVYNLSTTNGLGIVQLACINTDNQRFK